MTLALNWTLAVGTYLYFRTTSERVGPSWVEDYLLWFASVIAWMRVMWSVLWAADAIGDAVIARVLGWAWA